MQKSLADTMRRLLILLLLASFRGCCASTFSLDNENSNASRSSESSVAVAAPFCKDIAVESRAKEFRIPWFAKEHYIEVNEAASAIVCVIGKISCPGDSLASRIVNTWNRCCDTHRSR